MSGQEVMRQFHFAVRARGRREVVPGPKPVEPVTGDGRVPRVVRLMALAVHFDGLIRAVTPRTGVLFLANPNNPTGTRTSRKDVQRLLREVPDDVLIVMDEAYIEFLEDPVDLVPEILSGTVRMAYPPSTRGAILGFRCVKTR